MRLKTVSVKNLFGIFNHEIPMDHADGLTIIHGPNGFGKTVMLRMIACALRGESHIFLQIPFDEFRLVFVDGSAWIITPNKVKDAKASDGSTLRVTTVDISGKESEVDLKPKGPTPTVLRYLDYIDRSVPSPYSRHGSGWRDRAGNRYSLQQILELFPNLRHTIPPEILSNAMEQKWAPLGIDVFVVEANRLGATNVNEVLGRHHGPSGYQPYMYEPDSVPPPPPRIEQYSSDLVQRITEVRSQYAQVTQERDSTFPERLVQFLRAHREALQESEVVAKLEQLDRKRQSLITLGFLDKERVLGSFKEEDARLAREALTIYVDDVQKKLSAYDEMASRVGKLVDILNDRYQYKKVRISRDGGFVIESENGNRIKLDALSSGEQNELIVLYELLFRTPRGGLILVDEPEISLHVGWQESFLKDLIDILKLNEAYALVATHSPVLIGNLWPLTKELRGPTKNKHRGVAANA